MQDLRTVSDSNVLLLNGSITIGTFRKVIAALHNLVQKKGYSEITFDCSQVSAAFPNGMLPICAHVLDLSRNRIDFTLVLPDQSKLKNLFVNTGWASLLEPRHFPPAQQRISGRVPATRYSDSTEQTKAVDDLCQALLSTVHGLRREDLRAAEWALSEVTDNVLQHAQSPVGGLVQLSHYSDSIAVEFCVADAGRGIPRSLREGGYHVDEMRALELSVQEGVTRNKSTNQGNGLFGTFELCRKSQGGFVLVSDHASLSLDGKGTVRYTQDAVPFAGTIVYGKISLTKEGLLREALKFGGKSHVPADIIEISYESDDLKHIKIILVDEVRSFSSRIIAREVRTKLANLYEMLERQQSLVIDFDGVSVLSSSFADEVFGKLFLDVGPINFGSKVRLVKMNETVAGLIDRAIRLRMQAPLN